MNRYLKESLFSVLLCGVMLLGIALLLPDLSLGDQKISFVSFKEDTLKKAKQKAQAVADSITEKLAKDSLVIKKLGRTVRIDSNFTLKHADSITKENRIVNAGESTKPLDLFFKALIEERESTVIRIAHYGDSQLEGDRVTCHIRKNLQAKFGGGGPGYLSLQDVANSSTYVRTNHLISALNVFNNRAKGNLCGLSGNVFRIQKGGKIITDSVTGESKEDTRVPMASFALNDFRNFSHIRILAGKSTKPLKIKVSGSSRDTAVNKILTTEAPKEVNILDLDVPSGLPRLNFQFLEGDEMIYAIMADAPDGVAVDNYAIRGHSGDGLFLLRDQLLSEQLNATNTRLIIFQYGNNMVPYLENEKECKFYQTSFEKLFRKFKQAAPKASILVIGNGDMGRHEGGEAVSYAYTSCLDEVMKNAAANTGCAFWSMLKAMGGQGAIATWSRKGLANLDGHLTNKGQKLISDLIFKALMLEYNDYAEKYVKEATN